MSPANLGGRRAAALFRPDTSFDLALRLRSVAGAPMGEVFSYVSGLYFRGKLTYARGFRSPPAGAPGALVITSGRGLVRPEQSITLDDLTEFSRIAIDLSDSRYRTPLAADAESLAAQLPGGVQVVLLGSIATTKYVELLVEIFGDALCFPEPFVGMGDMQRGSVLLRAAESGIELPYVPARGAVRSLAASRSRKKAVE
ncbi:MAG: hypothetical protein GEU90_21155 [Gemmatimonas sp.]|nr:hypothetical protein [Gemmatimonas sp.]